MRISAYWLAVLAGLCAAPARALSIVATSPDLADLVREVGGRRVRVVEVLTGKAPPRQEAGRPGVVRSMRHAKALVYFGLGFESSFLGELLDEAANPDLRSDRLAGCRGPGCIDASAGVVALDRPSRTPAPRTRYRLGNPHYNLDPRNGRAIAGAIEEGLSRVDPQHAAEYDPRLNAFLSRLKARLARWKAQTSRLQGLPSVSYNKDTDYLTRFAGLRVVADVEPGTGAVTPARLGQVEGKMRAAGAKLVVCPSGPAIATCRALAARVGARVAAIDLIGGMSPGTDTFLDFQRRNIQSLLRAAAPPRR